MAGEGDTRVCSRCGQSKPISHFDARFVYKGTRLTCATCRGVPEDPEQRRLLFESRILARHYALLEAQREALARQAATDAAQKAWSAWERRYQLRLARFMKSLKRMDIDQAECHRVYSSAEVVGSLRRETWSEVKALVWALQPPYEPRLPRRKRASIGDNLKRELFDRQNGRCAYCDVELLPLEDRYIRPQELLDLEQWSRQTLSDVPRVFNKRALRFDPILPPDSLEYRAYRRLVTLDEEWRAKNRVRPNVEHKIPVRRGGTDATDNLVLACWACNRQKGLRTSEEYMVMPNDPVSRLEDLRLPLDRAANAVECESLYASVFIPVCEDLWALQAAKPNV
jgi:hypothetical protein